MTDIEGSRTSDCLMLGFPFHHRIILIHSILYMTEEKYTEQVYYLVTARVHKVKIDKNVEF